MCNCYNNLKLINTLCIYLMIECCHSYHSFYSLAHVAIGRLDIQLLNQEKPSHKVSVVPICTLTSGVTWGDLASSIEGMCEGWTYSISIKADSHVSGIWNGLLIILYLATWSCYLFSTVLYNSVTLWFLYIAGILIETVIALIQLLHQHLCNVHNKHHM